MFTKAELDKKYGDTIVNALDRYKEIMQDTYFVKKRYAREDACKEASKEFGVKPYELRRYMLMETLGVEEFGGDVDE